MNIIEAAKALEAGKTVISGITGNALVMGKNEIIGVEDDFGFFYPHTLHLDDLLATDYELVE
jgi:hypothetical protein